MTETFVTSMTGGGIRWSSTPYNRVTVAGVIDEIDYVYHVGIFGYWRVAIRERFHGPARNGLVIEYGNTLVFTGTFSRAVGVGQLRRHAVDLIHAHNVLRELARGDLD